METRPTELFIATLRCNTRYVIYFVFDPYHISKYLAWQVSYPLWDFEAVDTPGKVIGRASNAFCQFLNIYQPQQKATKSIRRKTGDNNSDSEMLIASIIFPFMFIRGGQKGSVIQFPMVGSLYDTARYAAFDRLR